MRGGEWEAGLVHAMEYTEGNLREGKMSKMYIFVGAIKTNG